MLSSLAAIRSGYMDTIGGGGGSITGITTTGHATGVSPLQTMIFDPATGTAHPAVDPDAGPGAGAASAAPKKSNLVLYVAGGAVVLGVVGVAIWLGRRGG